MMEALPAPAGEYLTLEERVPSNSRKGVLSPDRQAGDIVALNVTIKNDKYVITEGYLRSARVFIPYYFHIPHSYQTPTTDEENAIRTMEELPKKLNEEIRLLRAARELKKGIKEAESPEETFLLFVHGKRYDHTTPRKRKESQTKLKAVTDPPLHP
ncbi:hypothetical protein ACFL96_20170 [Thermoproteota archaeon]